MRVSAPKALNSRSSAFGFQANKELSRGFDNHDNKEMVAWLLTQYQRLAVKSEADKQYGVSLGCYKEIANLVIKPNLKQRNKKTFPKSI